MSRRHGFLLGALALAAALPAHAGTFVIGAASGVRNDEVVVPIRFGGDGSSVDAMLDLTFNGMYLNATAAQGANGGDCAVMPGFLPNVVRVLAPAYTGLPLDSPATDICYVTLRIEPFPPTANLGLFPASAPVCVTDAGTAGPGCTSNSGTVTVLSVVSKPANGSAIAFAGEAGDTIATRSIGVFNSHTDTTQTLSNCTISPAGAFTLAAFDPNIDIGGQRDLVVDCALPPAGTSVTATLSCTTSDPAVPSLDYALSCAGAPLASAPTPDDPLESSNGDAGDRFGASIAVTDLGDTEVVVVGAPEAGDGGGQVYVFERSPGSSLEEKRLTDESKAAVVLRPRAKAIGDKFGESVAVSPDGAVIAVGSPQGGAGNGVVTLYQRPISGTWETPATLPPVTIVAPPTQGAVTAAGFGGSLAFASDNTLVIGADKSSVAGATNAGAAFVFDVGGGGAVQLGMPMAPASPQANGRFGAAIAGTSSFVAVGAPGEAGEAGAVYAYLTSPAGAGAGTRSTRAGGGLGDKWGSSIAAAGGIVVVGAPDASTAAGTGSGLATVLMRGAGTSLFEHATLVPESGLAQGAGASIATNGDVVVVGAPLATVDAMPNRGRAYLYDLGASQTAQAPDVAIDPVDGAANDRFGGAVSIGLRRLLIGIPNDDDEVGPGGVQADAGSVDPYVLDRILRSGFE